MSVLLLFRPAHRASKKYACKNAIRAIGASVRVSSCDVRKEVAMWIPYRLFPFAISPLFFVNDSSFLPTDDTKEERGGEKEIRTDAGIQYWGGRNVQEM